MLSIDEKRLLRELKQGNNLEENYRWLFDQYYRRLIYFFGRQVSLEDSRDLAQETFIAVIKGIRNFKGECGLKTWIFRIAMNIGNNKARKESAKKRIQDAVSLDSINSPRSTDTLHEDTADPGPEIRYFAKEAVHRLREEILLLPLQMRNCVLLRVYQNRKYREIALVLGISIPTVKSHMMQAKSRLREKIGEYVDTIGLEES